jgi:hypothetical protein
MTSLREEIIDILKDVYYNNDQADPFEEHDADRIIELVKKRIDTLMSKYNPIESGYQTGWYNCTCEIKEMLLK